LCVAIGAFGDDKAATASGDNTGTGFGAGEVIWVADNDIGGAAPDGIFDGVTAGTEAPGVDCFVVVVVVMAFNFSFS